MLINKNNKAFPEWSILSQLNTIKWRNKIDINTLTFKNSIFYFYIIRLLDLFIYSRLNTK